MLRHVPFEADAPLSPRLDAVLEFWRGLRRGQAELPFADDLDLAKSGELCPDLILLGVFEKPERFRLDLALTPHAPQVEADLQGKFLDELTLPPPLDYLRAQADAAVESAAPTCYRHSPAGAERRYARLVLPMWGEGQIKLLLVAIEWL